jgi:hypothetical protein
MFGTIKLPQIKSKLAGSTKSILSDPINIGAAVGVGVLGAGISFAIDKIMDTELKIDNPLPGQGDWVIMKRYADTPSKWLTQSVIAGVGGSMISFGALAIPLMKVAPKALLPSAIGAVANMLGWTIVGAYRYFNFEVLKNPTLTKSLTYVRSDEEVKKLTEEAKKKIYGAGPPYTGKLFSGRLAKPVKEIYYVTDNDINVVIQKLHASDKYKTAMSYMITDKNGAVIPGYSNDLKGIIGSIGKVIAVDEQNRPTIIVKQSPGGYLLYKREGSRMVPAGLYMNEDAANNAIDLLILRKNSEDGQRSGMAYTVKPHFVMQSAGMVYRRH